MVIFLLSIVSLLTIALFAAVVGSYNMIDRLRDEVEDERSKHEACHAQAAAVLRDVHIRRISAEALREAGRRWDSPEEQAALKRLAEVEYKVGGPSMPTIWLTRMAEALDAVTDEAAERAESA